MAGVKPSFDIKWTKKGKATESVPGKTYEDVYKFFEKKNAAKQEWGKFSPTRPSLDFKPKKGGPITEVVLSIGFDITLPAWSKLSTAPKGCQSAWNKMLKALEKHEDNHRLILLEECAKLGEAITSKTDLDVPTLSALFKKFPSDVKAAQDLYDKKTGHGQKEGVFLPAPDACA